MASEEAVNGLIEAHYQCSVERLRLNRENAALRSLLAAVRAWDQSEGDRCAEASRLLHNAYADCLRILEEEPHA